MKRFPVFFFFYRTVPYGKTRDAFYRYRLVLYRTVQTYLEKFLEICTVATFLPFSSDNIVRTYVHMYLINTRVLCQYRYRTVISR